MATVVALLLVARTLSASAPCVSALPANIRPGLFQREMNRLLERSDTFRVQCRRIAAVPYVRVFFGVSHSVPVGARAESVIQRFEAGAIVACVTLGFSEDYIELIPHELEHVIEQLDRVRMDGEIAAQRAWMNQAGAVETRRAIAAGLRAREEFEGLAVEAVHPDGRKPPGPRDPFD